MNSALVNRIFEIPDEMVEVLEKAYKKYGDKTNGTKSPASEGKKRCERLIEERKLTYQQIKRMIHDMKYINRELDPVAWELNGGQKMFSWAVQALNNARREVAGHKESRARADEIGGIEGMRKNAYNQTHEKDGLQNILFGQNSDNNRKLTPMISEQIERIKQIMKYL